MLKDKDRWEIQVLHRGGDSRERIERSLIMIEGPSAKFWLRFRLEEHRMKALPAAMSPT